MAMDFWEAQRKARSRTVLYVTLFIAMTAGTAFFVEFALQHLVKDYHPPIPFIGLSFLIITLIVAGYNYLMYLHQGGGYIAESLGAWRVDPNSRDPREHQLYNVVQEVALAAALPMPAVYVLPSQEINAFAAGVTPQTAAITVTEGTLERLNRDELQGVIAHEFGHIYNGDMVISMRLAAMVMGFFFILYLGMRLLQGASFRDRSEEGGRGLNLFLLAAIAFMIAGILTWFVGSILKATVSRQREYLADACAVQFTRNPNGIANALRKIAKDSENDMPPNGGAYAHMYLEDHSSIFATHPPITKRIAAIEDRAYDESIK